MAQLVRSKQVKKYRLKSRYVLVGREACRKALDATGFRNICLGLLDEVPLGNKEVIVTKRVIPTFLPESLGMEKRLFTFDPWKYSCLASLSLSLLERL